MAGDVIDFMKLWTQGDPASERFLQKFLLMGLDKVVQGQSDVLSKIPVGQPVSSPVVRWLEEWGYPSQITAQLSGTSMTFSGYLFGKAITPESAKKVIRAGTILERPSDGVQAKVASVSDLTATVAAYGATVLSDDVQARTWDIISEVWSDYRDASEPRALDRIFREVGTQIHAETFEIPKTRKNTKYEIIADEVEHQITALLEKLRRQLAYAVLRSRPYHDGTGFVYGNKTEEPTMCGLCTWPIITQAELANRSVYVNKNAVALSKLDLDNLARHLWLDEQADYNKGNWWIATHPQYSRSHPGHRNRKQGKQDEPSDRVRPKQVDAYVNDRLKYERDKTAIGLLNLEKQLFGSGSEYAKGFQDESVGDTDGRALNQPAEFGSDNKSPFKLAGYNSVEGPYVFRWPSPEELPRWPRDMVRAFFQWYDSFLANNRLLMDPDALEEHHKLVRELADYFLKAGLKIEEYTRIMRAGEHRSKSEGGLHTGEGEGRGGWWNNEWRKFKKENPSPTEEEILGQLDKMEKAAEERKRLRTR